MHTSRTDSFDMVVRAGEPAYVQIAGEVRRRIARGELRTGVRLPPIRVLARGLHVDPGTVARAYRELEREGAIAARPGSGSYVGGGGAQRAVAEQQQGRLGLVMERAIAESLALGFTTDEVEKTFVVSLADWRERRAHSGGGRGGLGVEREKQVRFVGSHDLAVELLASHLGMLYPDIRVSTSFVGSLAGLAAVASREADVAGSHLLDDDSGEFNLPFVRRLMPGEAVAVLNLVQRFQGLMVAAGNPKRVRAIEDIARPGITFVNRQKGSGTRILLDSRLLRLGIAPGEIKGYEREEKTHMAVASLVAQGSADVGLGAQSAASVLGLDFILLLKERYDLVCLAKTFRRPALRKLKEVVASRSFRNMLGSLPGYDVSETGKVTEVTAASGVGHA